MNSTLKNLLILGGIITLGYLLYEYVLNKEPEVEDPKTEMRNNIQKYITIEVTDYTASGSTLLDHVVTVHNSTGYPIDSVRVNVEYIHDNGTLWHKQDFTMGMVKPNSDGRMRIPNPAHTTPLVKVAAIKSIELGFPEFKSFLGEKTDTNSIRKIAG